MYIYIFLINIHTYIFIKKPVVHTVNVLGQPGEHGIALMLSVILTAAQAVFVADCELCTNRSLKSTKCLYWMLCRLVPFPLHLF